ncbi:MAG: hypothetical protein RSD49_22625, partial [Hafnia sp.]
TVTGKISNPAPHHKIFQQGKIMKTAHYYASRSQKFLVIGVDGRHTEEKYEIANKSEARKLANELSAKPWNF